MIRLENVEKHYKGFNLNCSLEVKPGRITGLVGQNGSGKSTTFKAVLGLIHTDGGIAEVFVLKELAGKIDFTPILKNLSSVTAEMILGIMAALSFVLLFISYNISCRIMEKKEF